MDIVLEETLKRLGSSHTRLYSDEEPILTHEQCLKYTGQYRSVHSIADSFNGNLKTVLGID